ncbi:MAG: DUF547 domain-containing protein [Planctomycetota bacterium]|nr:DUF547 domain-containing protein [Planctomycetota bacterium]
MVLKKPLILNPTENTDNPGDLGQAQSLLRLAKTIKVNVFAGTIDPREACEDLARESAWLRSVDVKNITSETCARAFWINIYNALIIHGVFALNIKKSVSEAPSFFKRVSYLIGGQPFSLDVIEHGILRQNRGHPLRFGLPQLWPWDSRRRFVLPLDPRIHFALNCGAFSCPPIRDYDAEKLDGQLNLASESFISQNLSLVPDKKEIRLSRLFLWYARDFGTSWPARLRWMLPFTKDEAIKSVLKKAESWKRRFDDYDWSLA